jgi:hypothetical protein
MEILNPPMRVCQKGKNPLQGEGSRWRSTVDELLSDYGIQIPLAGRQKGSWSMSAQKPLAPDLPKASPPVRNPYIMNFCKALVEKKGEQHEPEALDVLLEDMYRVYENLLGQNMVEALPEDLRLEYLELSKNLNELSYAKIAEIFAKNSSNYQEIMKKTMKQFAEIYLRNRKFDPKDFQASPKFDPAAGN